MGGKWGSGRWLGGGRLEVVEGVLVRELRYF